MLEIAVLYHARRALADALTDLAQFVVQLLAAVVLFCAVLMHLGGAAALFTMWDRLLPADHAFLTGRTRRHSVSPVWASHSSATTAGHGTSHNATSRRPAVPMRAMTRYGMTPSMAVPVAAPVFASAVVFIDAGWLTPSRFQSPPVTKLFEALDEAD